METSERVSVTRLGWVSFYRVVIAIVSLLLIIFWKSKIDVFPDVAVFYKILALVFLLSLGYGILIKRNIFTDVLAWIQLSCDLLIISAIVAYTGVLDSPFVVFYVFTVVEGGLFFAKNGAYAATFANLASIAAVFGAHYWKIFPFDVMHGIKAFASPGEYYYSYSIFSLGILAIGLLIGYLTSETTRIKDTLAQRQAELYDTDRLKTAIIRSIDNGLLVFDMNHTVTYINEIAQTMNDKIRKTGNAVLLPDILNSDVSRITDKQVVERYEKKVVLDNGDVIWLDCSIVPLLDQSNRVIGSLLSFQDLTSYKDMEEKLRIADKFAFLGKLSAVIAHEIRNPLASLKGGVEYLRDSTPADAESKKIMDIIQREIGRLNKVINDFLYYAKITTESWSNIYLKNLIEEIWFELMFATDNKERFGLEYRGPDEMVIRGEPNQIRQVFLNILMNAIQIMQEKHGGGVVTVTAASIGDIQCVDVEDDGGGISDECIDKIFDPFFTTRKDGTGLGLAIVYKIMLEHGGRISVRNAENGALFSLRFAYERNSNS